MLIRKLFMVFCCFATIVAIANAADCHRALQNRPLMGASKPAEIQGFISVSFRPWRSLFTVMPSATRMNDQRRG